MIKLSFLLVMILINLPGYSQTVAGIKGIVADEQDKPIAASTISLLNANDSSVVKFAISDKSGRYEFPDIKNGAYLLMFTSVGYEKTYAPAFNLNGKDHEVMPVKLYMVSKDLGAVTVTAKKPFVETKLDKTVINVDASPTNAGATALDILEKSPGIMVNNDGDISLRGKQGVIVLIDGKQTFLSSSELANLLRNTPASALDLVEIMTNPSSKFDAAGNSGIINIKTKKGKNNGFNGSIMIGATTSIYQLDGKTLFIPKSQNSFNFNYKKNKFNFFGNYNPNFFKGRNTLRFEGTFLNADREVFGYSTTATAFRFKNNNHTLKLGMDWYANNKNVFGIVLSGFHFEGLPAPSTIANLYDENYVLQSRLVSNTINNVSFRNGTLNLNWKHNFDSTGKELTADFDWVKYDNTTNMLLTTNYFNSQLQPTSTTFLRGTLPAEIDIYTFRSDYVKPFKGGRFEAGVKTSYVANNNLVDYEVSNGNKWDRDSVRSNHFIYKEYINAGYVNYNFQLSKWTFQAGLRGEHTYANGNQVVSKSTFKRDTFNLFPTLFVSFALNDQHTLTTSYGRRITRPNYQDLNPFIFFLDTLSYRKGNVFLRPQYTNNFELSHAFKGKFITTLNYNVTDDVISQILKPESETSKIRFLTVDNVARSRNFGLAITAPFTINKWWNTNIFTNIFNNHYTGTFDTVNIDMAFTSFMVNLTNSFTISKGFTAELSGFYRHKGISNLSIMDPVYQMSIGAQKQVMDGRGTIRLNVRDPFAWQQFSGENNYGQIKNTFSFRPDIRQVTATFTWRFGNNGQNNQSRPRTNSSQEEQNRVGQSG
jgi:hypothetical protein